jgi:HAD superfamily hydrolase (TIGR01549 family)
MIDVQVVFFDIGETLAIAHLTPDDRLARLETLPGVLQSLGRLKHAGFRLGIISNTGEETSQTMRRALSGAKLYDFFEPTLLIYSSEVNMKKDSPEIFRLASERAGFATQPSHCLFVGDDQRERNFAADAGLQVATSPVEVAELLVRS